MCKRSYHNINFIGIWPEKPLFWRVVLKFNNLGLALGTNLKFYTSLSKGLKLKVRKFRGVILTFAEVTGEKLVERPFPPPILNRVKGIAKLWNNWRSSHFSGLTISKFINQYKVTLFPPKTSSNFDYFSLHLNHSRGTTGLK